MSLFSPGSLFHFREKKFYGPNLGIQGDLRELLFDLSKTELFNERIMQ